MLGIRFLPWDSDTLFFCDLQLADTGQHVCRQFINDTFQMLTANVTREGHRCCKRQGLLGSLEQMLSSRGCCSQVPASVWKALPCVFPRVCGGMRHVSGRITFSLTLPKPKTSMLPSCSSCPGTRVDLSPSCPSCACGPRLTEPQRKAFTTEYQNKMLLK